MANVAEYVAQIRAAIYGEQVRESIALSIEAMNTDNIETKALYDETIDDAEAATDAANTAAAGATSIRDEVQQKLNQGEFIGEQGPQGEAATIRVGTVQTGDPGTAAQVTNSGTQDDAVLNFVIPRGASGTVENLDTIEVTFPIDTVYQNIASGMTIRQLFSRIQYLLDPLLSQVKAWYGTSSTAAGTSTKTVSCSGFVLETGACISVKMTYANTYTGTIYLNVNSTGAKQIRSLSGSTSAIKGMWNAGEVVDFVYDGSYWLIRGQDITADELATLESALGL